MKKIFTLILIGVVLVGCFKLLERNYEKAIDSCIKAGNDVSYCEYHAN